MKKLVKSGLILVIILNFSYLHAQFNYSFNQVVKSTFSTKKSPNQKQTHFFNSNDDSFYMQVFKQGDSVLSRIYDLNKQKVHYLYLADKENQKFKFLKSKVYHEHSPKVFEFSELGSKNPIEELFVTIRNPDTDKKASYNLKVRESKTDLFHVFKYSVLDDLGINPLWSGQNFIVVEAIGENADGTCQQYKLNSIQKVNLSLNIPSGK